MEGESTGNFVRQGSLRRVLPADNNKENAFIRHNEEFNKIYRSVHQEYSVLAEYAMIQSENVKGVYVIPSRENVLIWFGVVFVRSGLYEDGIFRFNIFLDKSFPETTKHPKVVFQSEVYHPSIDLKSNELHLKPAFPTWNKHEQHIWQILKYIQWVFHHLEDSFIYSSDSELVSLYKNNFNEFKSRVKATVSASHEHLYDEPAIDDKHYIAFEKYNPEIHRSVQMTMLTPNNDDFFKLGHSWVLPGSIKSLGRPPSPDSESDL